MRADIMHEWPEQSRSRLRQCGDTPPEEFRKQLHELADWIADFRENIERLRVAPNDKPGAIREQLPKRGPEEGVLFERILVDVDNVLPVYRNFHIRFISNIRSNLHIELCLHILTQQ